MRAELRVRGTPRPDRRRVLHAWRRCPTLIRKTGATATVPSLVLHARQVLQVRRASESCECGWSVTGAWRTDTIGVFALPRVAARVSLCQIVSLLFACAGRRADAPGYDLHEHSSTRKTQLTGVGSESEISPAVAKVKGAEGVREEEEQEGHGGEVVHACERMGQLMGQLASCLRREPASLTPKACGQ